MGIRAWPIALFILFPSTVAAQPSTAEGARALVRGDAQAAVRALTPLAESTSPDPLAEFLLGMAYQPMRGFESKRHACQLFTRASVAGNPLESQARAMATHLRQLYGSLCGQAAPLPADVPLDATTPPASGPESATSAGVEAFVRAEYPRAAAILRPIAEKVTLPSDPIAEFFVAAMYDSGRGVEANPMRACALYTRASGILPIAPPAAPFVAAAEAMRITYEQSMSKAAIDECRVTARIGFASGFEPITFVLEPDHWIAFTLTGATITYRGAETIALRGFLSPGMVLLPVRHTALEVGPSRSVRRHFIEIAWWRATRKPREWQLTWHLFEVGGGELIPVVMQSPVTLTADAPPAADAFDLRSVVHLDVTARGHAEWVMTTGSSPRSTVIPTDEERREAARVAREHEAREARIDWRAAHDPDRMPALQYVAADGCGFATVYGWSDDRAEAIRLHADIRTLQLSATPRTFDLSGNTPGLAVVLQLFEHAARESPDCTDVGMNRGRIQEWRATGGTITIELSDSDETVATARNRKAVIHITGAEFVDGTGRRVRQTAPIVLTAMVGGVVG